MAKADRKGSPILVMLEPKLIFLDFDGVLHPCTAGTFIHLDLLQDFMRAHPAVLVVLSTTWRLDHTWDELLMLFADDIRPRIVGVTPSLPETIPAPREAEIQAWRAENRASRLAWVALDDDPTLFRPGCPNLVRCETIKGLRKAQLLQVAEKLGLVGPERD